MSDIVERLRADFVFHSCVIDAADEIERLRAEIGNLADDIDSALRTITAENEENERLRAENLHLLQLDVRQYAERTTVEDNVRLRARVAEIEAEAFRLAANQCHHGSGTESGDHRCRYQDRIVGLEAENAKLREAVTYYVEKHCAGYSDCGDASITGGDCHGCVAKRALPEATR